MEKEMTMRKVVLATKNQGKLKEFAEMLAPLGLEIITASELGVNQLPEVEEKGSSFEENAYLKAKAYYDLFGYPALADDSGLSIDVLGGRPGIYSARYAGDKQDDWANIQKVLSELKNVPDEQKTARFICAICYVEGERHLMARGECEGMILSEPRGEHGFGYDPIFFIPSLGKTMAELTLEEKNKISHRYQALLKLAAMLRER